MYSVTGQKKCPRCESSENGFYANKTRRDGLDSLCKICRLSANIRWKNTNPDAYKNSHTSWHKEHAEADKISKEIWRKGNPGKVSTSIKKWRLNNPGKSTAYTRKYQAAKIQRTPPWLTSDQLSEIQQFYIDAKEIQWLSDSSDPLEVDHIVPLQGELVSGLHVPWNLRIVSRSVNRSKSVKLVQNG